MRHKYSSTFAFNDLLFNVLVGFVFLFVIAFLLINPPTKQADVPAKAEFIIVLEWEGRSKDDIDLWVQYEDTAPVGYLNKEGNGLHLERDDLGSKTDTVEINGEFTTIYVNREVITVRGIVPGNYYIGIHGYLVKGNDAHDIKVSVIDVNPYKEIYIKEYARIEMAGKINVPAIYIDYEGSVVDIYDHFRELGPGEIGTSYNTLPSTTP